ncbi:MAG: PAS domain-containing protein [Pseudomonadota bacterium]
MIYIIEHWGVDGGDITHDADNTDVHPSGFERALYMAGFLSAHGIDVNKAFEKMTGYTQAEVLGKNCRFLQGKENEQEGVNQLRKAIQNKETVEVTLRNYRKNGELFYNHLLMSPLFDSKGNLLYFLGVQYDITQRVYATEEIKKLKEQIDQCKP